MVDVARQRIWLLFGQAERAASQGEAQRARRYIELARRIGTRYNVRVPSEFRWNYCRGCSSFLGGAMTARFRLRRGVLVRTCSVCGRIDRWPWTPRRSLLRVREARGGPSPQAPREEEFEVDLGTSDGSQEPED
jgi:ribonuclease P protein subunit RPR2